MLMKLNRKGMVEVVAVLWVVGIVVGGLVAWLAGPSLIKATGDVFSGGSKSTSKAIHTKTTQEPIVLGVDAKGKDIIGYRTCEESSNTSLAEQPKPTLWEKIKAVFWVIVGVAIFCMIFPASILARIKNAALAKVGAKLDELQDTHDEFTGDAKKIVASIDDGLATMDANIKAAKTMADSATDAYVKNTYTTIAASLIDMKQDFMAAMSKTQDSTTKLLVRELKND